MRIRFKLASAEIDFSRVGDDALGGADDASQRAVWGPKMSVRSGSPLLVWHLLTIEVHLTVCPLGLCMALQHSLPCVDRLCSTVHEKDGLKG